ncbi:MAG: polysaccharide biosynthesis C-terminal domain-containing protein [Holosporaceae bacterium]|jgi:MATE family multidrug resistance protein|nr:polysaccharide biosynthesis C-terminal domain-containing protein [Holosporaceae bacterium]
MQNCKHSVREVLKFTIPMVLTSLSASLMFNVDRMMLAHYSVDSMNSAALAGNFTAMISYIVISIAQIATVFVGQYNGLGEYKKTGWPAWQMIYLGLFSFLALVPLAMICHHFGIFPEYYREDGMKYLRIIMAFAGLHAISAALSSFFIGRGESFLVIVVVFMANILNFLLNACLIFGIDGFFAPLGITGAAIATVVSEIFSALILLGIFLNKINRKLYNTHDNKFRKKLFFDCVKIGLPLSFGKMLSLLAWFVLLLLFNYASKDLATIEAFAVNVWAIFIFFADGCGRAISSMSANLIGENNLPAIKKLLKLFLGINLIVCLIFSIPLVFYQDSMLWFMDGVKGVTHLYSEFKFIFVSIWVLIFTDSIFYLVCGVLNSGGDTKFPVCLELATLWLGCVVPTAILYATGNLTTVRVTYSLLMVTGTINSLVVYWRYRRLKWFTRLI